MNVVFVNYANFLSNSAIQMFHLANEMVARGHACICVVPSGKESVLGCGGPARFTTLEYADLPAGVTFPDGRGPDLIHTWTPREGVRKLTLELARRYRCRYVVHLEDNEDLVTAKLTGLDPARLLDLPDSELDPRVGDSWAHPRRFRQFVAEAAGVTALIDRLLELKPAEVPGAVFWPACDPAFHPQPADVRLRRALGIRDADFVLTYNGNAHPANAAEMRSLYLAVGLLNRAGRSVTLVRLGVDVVDFLGTARPWLEHYVVTVGTRPYAEQPRYLALADALVQPGRADPFNDLRFPSKLPEFLAMGRPVVLPETNLGRYLTDGEHCLLLREGHCREIADKVDRLIADPALRRKLGEGGLRFGEEYLRWSRAAEIVEGLYERALSAEGERAPATNGTAALHSPLLSRYADFRPAPLGYATVEDFCDSREHLPDLASQNGDLKDVQRPWVVKAICGAVPPGSRLLEIGGGDPWVADVLTRLGYDVTVIDPYDGRDQGPTAFAEIARRHPHIRFVRGLFPDALPPGDGDYGCIYSVSVLEHVPLDAVPAVFAAIRTHLGRGGMTIHAVDHVHRGAGAEEHLVKLRAMATALGFAPAELEAMLRRLDADPETYFLSAEGHDMWRGGTPYRDFPMRRCPSIQFCVRVERPAAVTARDGETLPAAAAARP